MIKKSKKFILTTLSTLCIVSTIFSTGVFASEAKAASFKNESSVAAKADDVLGWHNVLYGKTYPWGTVTVPAKILVAKSSGKYYMSSEDYGTPTIQLAKSSDSATVNGIKDKKIDKTTYKVEITVSHKGMSPSFCVYYTVDPKTGTISASNVK